MTLVSIDNQKALRNGDLILIADDDALTRKILERSLQKDGYRVASAADGVECLDLFKQERPVLALVDAMMPNMDGFDCCEALLAEPDAAHFPVLIITGLEDQESIDKAFAVGAADYITKPIRWPVLRHRLRLLVEHLREQESLEANHRELQQLVMTDALTKLANRRRFDEELDKEWRRALRDERMVSLIMIDIDSFKPYNDNYGHPQGDRCLQQVAKALSGNVHRGGDLIARYGGEEFAVVLPNTHGAGAYHVAERIRQAVWDAHLPHLYGRRDQNGTLLRDRVTISLGVANLAPQQDLSSSNLVQLADEALYKAKALGGNNALFLEFPMALTA